MSKFDDWIKNGREYFYGRYSTIQKEAFEAGQKAGQEWIPVSNSLPDNCRNVFIQGMNDCGMVRTAKANYCRKFELEASECTDEECCDYKETNDKYYVQEGWYESNTSSEIDYAIDFTVTHWQELPPTDL